MHFSASVAICVFLNEDNEEKWVQVTFCADYETTLKKAFMNEFRIQRRDEKTNTGLRVSNVYKRN